MLRVLSTHLFLKQRLHPGLLELGQHVIRALMAEEFDVAVSNKLPTGPRGSADMPHAFGFVYERIMKGKVVPNLPLFTNTFYPPNQPSAKRCYRFGEIVAKAIASWDSDLRVAVFGSGGLSHEPGGVKYYKIDEEFDRTFLDLCVKVVRGEILVFAAEDNLVRGASGVAVQNFNRMFGFDERIGLM